MRVAHGRPRRGRRAGLYRELETTHAFIHIDDAVMAHLREHGRLGESYTDVVRALIGLPRNPRLTASADASEPGALMPPIMLAEGETVTWHRRRRGEVHTATVDDAGRLVTAEGAVFLTPAACASALAGYPCKGWPKWRTTAGQTLQQLRDGAAAADPPRRQAGGTAAGSDLASTAEPATPA